MNKLAHWNFFYASRHAKNEGLAWGDLPDEILWKHLGNIPKGQALDLGCGDGRNSLFLASNGFSVTAVDHSSAAIRRLRLVSRKRKLPVETRRCNVCELTFPTRHYSLIVLANLVHFLGQRRRLRLYAAVRNAVRPGGFVLVSARLGSQWMWDRRWTPVTKREIEQAFARFVIHRFATEKRRECAGADGPAEMASYVRLLAAKQTDGA
ncbi:MAG: type 12 methyltransferase [Parcubacteria group bacterium Gr01-1014_38]|nr:MAG: type 12 methyltransferase [Parcubacteria group bacterium Gr01-1014_38]